MSVPVIGTVLALCLAFFLPSAHDYLKPLLREVAIPDNDTYSDIDVDSDHDSDSDCTVVSWTFECPGAEPPQATQDGLSVRICHNREEGLIGLSCKKPDHDHPHCFGCGREFGAMSFIYEWMNRNHQKFFFHELCFIDQHLKDVTLNDLKELKAGTNDDYLLMSLLNLERELTSMEAKIQVEREGTSEGILVIDEDTAVETPKEPPRKLRRLLNLFRFESD